MIGEIEKGKRYPLSDTTKGRSVVDGMGARPGKTNEKGPYPKVTRNTSVSREIGQRNVPTIGVIIH